MKQKLDFKAALEALNDFKGLDQYLKSEYRKRNKNKPTPHFIEFLVHKLEPNLETIQTALRLADRLQSERWANCNPFPVMRFGKIPWYIAQFAYSNYCDDGGSGQSLERVAERGGFSMGEMDKYYPAWRSAYQSFNKAMAAQMIKEETNNG